MPDQFADPYVTLSESPFLFSGICAAASRTHPSMEPTLTKRLYDEVKGYFYRLLDAKTHTLSDVWGLMVLLGFPAPMEDNEDKMAMPSRHIAMAEEFALRLNLHKKTEPVITDDQITYAISKERTYMAICSLGKFGMFV